MKYNIKKQYKELILQTKNKFDSKHKFNSKTISNQTNK